MHTHMVVCMHIIFWHARAHILAQLEQILDIEVSTEVKGHIGHEYDVCAYALKQACILICMHALFLYAWEIILAKIGQIREIELSMETGGHADQ